MLYWRSAEMMHRTVAVVAQESSAPRARATEPEARAITGIAQRAIALKTQIHQSQRSTLPAERRC